MLLPVPPDIDPDDDADDRQRDQGDLSEVLVDQGLVGTEEIAQLGEDGDPYAILKNKNILCYNMLIKQ